jgi:hypothetical protein
VCGKGGRSVATQPLQILDLAPQIREIRPNESAVQCIPLSPDVSVGELDIPGTF